MIFKIIVTVLCGIFCTLILKDKNPHGAFAVSVSVSVVILGQIIPMARTLFRKIEEYKSLIGMDGELFNALIKVIIIALATRITAELCRDNGERAAGAKVELAGVIAGIICAVPLVDKALLLIGAL